MFCCQESFKATPNPASIVPPITQACRVLPFSISGFPDISSMPHNDSPARQSATRQRGILSDGRPFSGNLACGFPGVRRPFLELREIVMDIMPMGPGPHENMRFWPHTRISFNRAERYRGNLTFIGSRQCRAALTTKAPSDPRHCFINFYQVFARDPLEIARMEFGIGRECRTVLAPAHRAMTVIRIKQRPGDFVTYLAA